MRRESEKTMKWSILASLSPIYVLLLLFMPFPSNGQSGGAEQIQNYTLEYQCEIAIVLDGSGSVRKVDFETMVEIVHQFPKHFRMGKNYSRVAVVSFGNESKIDLPLTDDEKVVQTLKIPREGGATNTDLALKDVKEKVFVDARPGAMKIVVLITDGIPQDAKGVSHVNPTEDAAAELKSDGSLVYVAYVGPMPQDTKEHVERVAGDPSQVFPMKDFDTLKKSIIPKIREHVICQFDPVCRFDDPQQQKCVEAWWRPIDSDLNCTNTPPAQFPRQCQMGDCNVTCEKWPWQKWMCDGSNAGQQNINREGTMPPKQQSVFENCPRQKGIVCPTGSLTMSSTAPPAVSPTFSPAVSPAVSPTMSLSVPPITPSTVSPINGGPGAVVPSKDPQDASVFPLWAIAVIAVVGGLLLLLILMAVVLIARKRMKGREAAAMAKKKAQMAAMAKKMTGPLSQMSDRSLSQSARSYGLEYGNVPAKMIDHSVGVSLAPLKTKPSASKMPSSAVKMQTLASPASALVGTKRKPSLSPAQGPVGAKGLKQSTPPAPVGEQGPKPSLGGTQGAKWTPPKSASVKSNPVSKPISTAKSTGTKKEK